VDNSFVRAGSLAATRSSAFWELVTERLPESRSTPQASEQESDSRASRRHHIRALLLAFSIDPRQVGARRRPDARGFGKRRQELLVALAAIASHDAAQRRIGFERRGVDADRLPFDQARRAQALQHLRKDGPMRFEIDQPTRARKRRVVRRRVLQTDAQKVPATRTNSPRATRSRVPSRCPRSSQSRATGNRSLAADLAAPSSRRKT